MLTTTHAYATGRLVRGRRNALATVLGAVAPDLPALLLTPIGHLAGHRGGALVRWTYHRPAARLVHGCAHAAWAPAALAALARHPTARAFARGWAGHLAADYLTHHDDAWPPLFPASAARFRSPISYWQPEHHARSWSTAEVLALGLATVLDRSRAGRAAGAIALAVAAAPLAHRGAWSAHACATHAQSGGASAVTVTG